MKRILTVAAIAAFTAAAWAQAAFTYQGKIVDAGGATMTGSHGVTFRLYKDASAEKKDCVWGRKVTVDMSGGTFNVVLDDTSGNPVKEARLADVFSSADNLYLGIEVEDTSGEIAPRQRIAPVPRAVYAQNVKHAAGDFTVEGNATFNGKVTIGGVTVSGNAVTATGATFAGTTRTDVLDVTQNATIDGKTVIAGNLTVERDKVAVAGSTVSAPNAKLSVKSLEVTTPSFIVNGAAGSLPKGSVIMWYGNENDVPAGWAICNGRKVNGVTTPDLTGRTVVGAGTSAVRNGYAADGGAVYSRGDNGGERTHVITKDEMPKHNHKVTRKTADLAASWDSDHYFYGQDCIKYDNWESFYTQDEGKGYAHNNMQPYMALYFIMKVVD